jgi:hypothetical protein
MLLILKPYHFALIDILSLWSFLEWIGGKNVIFIMQNNEHNCMFAFQHYHGLVILWFSGLWIIKLNVSIL